MSKFLLPFLILFLGLWLVGGSWWYANKFGMPIANTIAQASALPALYIEDGDFKMNALSNFHFRKSSDQIVIPWETEKILRQLANYLTNENSRLLVITGKHTTGEINTTSYQDLGFARAAAVEQVLIKYGAHPDAIILQSEKKSRLFFRGNLLFDGINFSFEQSTTNSSPSSVGAVNKNKNSTNADRVRPLNLYYENNKEIVLTSPELKNYLVSLKSYMQRHPNSIVYITGHTDNTGSRQQNLKLAKNRAIIVKTLMTKNGINTSRITTKSKGPDQPIASNETAAGRKKNRRVEVRIEK